MIPGKSLIIPLVLPKYIYIIVSSSLKYFLKISSNLEEATILESILQK